MPDGGVNWLHSAGLDTGGTRINSFSVNNFSFLHQLTNELADGFIANYITRTTQPYNIIIMHAFLLMIEIQMQGRVNFPLAENHTFDSNSAAS